MARTYTALKSVLGSCPGAGMRSRPEASVDGSGGSGPAHALARPLSDLVEVTVVVDEDEGAQLGGGCHEKVLPDPRTGGCHARSARPGPRSHG